MPFTYEFKLGESVKPDEKIVFQSWIKDAWGEYHSESVPLAVLHGAEGAGKIYTNAPCELLEHALLKKGDEINFETILGKAADDESIPYGKPHALFVYER